MGVLDVYIFLCLLALGDSDDTLSGKQGPFCSPAKCADGTCYCSENNLGWWNGGVGQAFGSSNCYRAGRGECQCMSCGQASTQCLDIRCNDDGTEDSSGFCYSTKSDGTKTRTNYRQYDYCYLKENPCQDCNKYAEHKVGCGRTSPGECQPCEEGLAYGKFWKARGSCDQVDCSIPARGQYVHGACSTTKDASLRPCADFRENQFGRNYYCPGNSVPLKAPDNSVINEGWYDFTCNPGFYRNGLKCISCPPGSCCINEARHDCPVNYFSQAQKSSCSKCDLACPVDGQLRRKCDANSIQNQPCIPCGMCGSWPSTGYNCVTNPQDYVSLESSCCPCG